jgi:uncharacterized protein (TIGR02996 family)
MSPLYQHPHVLALLQAAREQPEDDAPRLVLADWLEEAVDAHLQALPGDDMPHAVLTIIASSSQVLSIPRKEIGTA